MVHDFALYHTYLPVDTTEEMAFLILIFCGKEMLKTTGPNVPLRGLQGCLAILKETSGVIRTPVEHPLSRFLQSACLTQGRSLVGAH